MTPIHFIVIFQVMEQPIEKLKSTIHKPLLPTTQGTSIAELLEAKALQSTAQSIVTVSGGNIEQFPPCFVSNSLNIFSPTPEQEIFESSPIPLTKEQVDIFDAKSRRKAKMQDLESRLNAPNTPIAELYGTKILIAYRLIRSMAQIRGDIGIGDLLLEKLSSSSQTASKWDFPLPFYIGRGCFRGCRDVIHVLQHCSNSPSIRYSYRPSPESTTYYITRGLPLLPPPLIDAYFPADQVLDLRDTPYSPKGYDPSEDPALTYFLLANELLSEFLNLENDSEEARKSVAALLNPKIARLAWPGRDDLETFEENVLFPYISNLISYNSYQKVIDTLQRPVWYSAVGSSGEIFGGLGLTRQESIDYLETAKYYNSRVATFSVKTERSVMLNKLDTLSDICRESGMVNTELKTHQLRMQAVGLTQAESPVEDLRKALSKRLRAKIDKYEDNNQKPPQLMD